MNITQSSLEEARYYLILSRDLQYGENDYLSMDISEVSRLLESYSHAIETTC